MAHFVFMLTHDDRTVDNAAEIMPTLADTGLRYVGFKDVGADLGSRGPVVELEARRQPDAEVGVLLAVAQEGVVVEHGAGLEGRAPAEAALGAFVGAGRGGAAQQDEEQSGGRAAHQRSEGRIGARGRGYRRAR